MNPAPSARDPSAPVPVPEITVIVPTFNAEATIGEQLDALAGQTFAGPWEVVVVDNGSTDRSAEIAHGYTDRLDLRVLSAADRRGAAHARNAGVRVARAPKVAFVDADDVVAPDWLAAIVRALDDHDAVASRFDAVALNSQEQRQRRSLAQDTGLGRHNYAAFLPHAGGSGLAVRTTVHEALGGFDENMFRLQDTDYSWRLQLAGYDLHFEPSAVLHVRFRSGEAATVRQALEYGRYNGRLYVRYRRHGMARAPILDDLVYLGRQTLRLLGTRDRTRRAKRLSSIANRLGIVVGRLETAWRRP